MLRLLTAATLFAAAFLSAPAQAATPTSPTSPTKIMVVGSSTTHGGAGDYTWRHRLWQHLTGNQVAVDFVGPYQTLAQGSTAYADPAFDTDHDGQWGRFLGTFPDYPVGAKDTIEAEVRTHTPDYLVVMLGLNDLFWFSSRSPYDVALDMVSLVRNARVAHPGIRFALVAVQPTKGALDNATLAGRVSEYNWWLSEIARIGSTGTSPIAYVPQAADYQADYQQSEHDSYDGTHPNARGEIRIADSVADVLSARFGLGPLYPLSLDGVPVGPVLAFTLSCTVASGKATLTWTESPGATGYWFQRRIAGGEWTPSAYQFKFTDQPLANNWLTPGVTYEYRLQAAKMYDRGVYSPICAVTA